MDKNSLDALLEWFHPDRDRAAIIYQKTHTRLTYFFKHNDCRQPEECADECLNRILYPVGSGSGTGSFTITSGDTTSVDQIEFKMRNADLSRVLKLDFVQMEYKF